MTKNRKCWACKRTLVGESKFGLCSDCVNKYGTPTAVILAIGAGVGIKQLVNNSGKIIQIATNLVKH